MTVIRWKLKEVMEQNSIRASDLGDILGVSKNAIANLRKSDMPRISADRLNQILLALNKLKESDSGTISSSDLIEFMMTPEELDWIRSESFTIPKI